MRKMIGILVVLVGLCALPLRALEDYREGYFSLPQYARSADIIGIAKFKGGAVSNEMWKGESVYRGTPITFEMQNLWFGAVSNQTLTVRGAYGHGGFPPPDTECIVFVNIHDIARELESFSWDFVTNRAAYVYQTPHDSYWFKGTNSFFRTDADSGEEKIMTSDEIKEKGFEVVINEKRSSRLIRYRKI